MAMDLHRGTSVDNLKVEFSQPLFIHVNNRTPRSQVVCHFGAKDSQAENTRVHLRLPRCDDDRFSVLADPVELDNDC